MIKHQCVCPYCGEAYAFEFEESGQNFFSIIPVRFIESEKEEENEFASEKDIDPFVEWNIQIVSDSVENLNSD